MVTSIFFRRFRSPWSAMGLWIPLSAALIAVSVPGRFLTGEATVLYLASGVLAWTLVEYVLHRYVFHWVDESAEWKTYSEIASGLHMQHHRSADRADLIVAPPFVSLVFAALLYGIFLAVTRSLAAAALLEGGLIAGYLFYEWVHFMSHRFHPRSRVAKYLRRYHLQHHFRGEERQFGVTSPLWDMVFGTYRSPPIRHAAAKRAGARS